MGDKADTVVARARRHLRQEVGHGQCADLCRLLPPGSPRSARAGGRTRTKWQMGRGTQSQPHEYLQLVSVSYDTLLPPFPVRPMRAHACFPARHASALFLPAAAGYRSRPNIVWQSRFFQIGSSDALVECF